VRVPIYEYRCNDCGSITSVFVRTVGAEPDVTCSACDGGELTRVISRVAVLRSEESRLESLADPSNPAGLDEEDPRSLGRFMRQMSQEMGEDLGPEFDEVVDRLESGQSPDDIESAMPDLGEDLGAGLGADDDII
jgi:putative FmdB family regulatory protein